MEPSGPSGPVTITVTAYIDRPLDLVWERWTAPAHVTQWNAANDDWHCPRAVNDLRVGGRFNYRMEARDGSFGFDFEGTYATVEPNRRIVYTMDDGRTCLVTFATHEGRTLVTETFDAETENPVEMQREGWQAILNRFKAHCEAQG